MAFDQMGGRRMTYGLYPRFPGAKRPLLRQINWASAVPSDTMISPFSGAACLEHYLLAQGKVKRLYVADPDPTIRAAWECVKAGQYDFRDVADDLNYQINWVIEPFFEDGAADEACQSLIDDLGQIYAGKLDYDVVDLYAMSLVFRRLTFGGVVRSNKTNTGLNIKAVAAQIPTLSLFRFELPWIPSDAEVLVFSNWQECIDAAIADNVQGAFSFVDPPYYSEKPMDPCYAHHLPRHVDTLNMAIGAVERLRPISSWVFACNYITDALMGAYSDADHYTEGGVIDVIANHGDKATKNIEGFWQWGLWQPLLKEYSSQLELAI